MARTSNGFSMLRENFNKIKVNGLFDFWDITDGIKVSKQTLLTYRSKLEGMGYMERVSVKLNKGKKEKIIFKKIRDIEQQVNIAKIEKYLRSKRYK